MGAFCIGMRRKGEDADRKGKDLKENEAKEQQEEKEEGENVSGIRCAFTVTSVSLSFFSTSSA